MERIRILEVPIDAVTMPEAIARITAMLKEQKQHHVMTPNSEMLVEARRNTSFRAVLEASDLNLPDSAGLLWAARYTGQKLPERVAGVDVVAELCQRLGPEHPVFLLGGRDGAAAAAGEALMKQNPKLVIAGIHEGDPSDESAAAIISAVNASGASLLLVAYGAPQQDLWIAKHMKSMPHVRIAMGVGGTFDFLSGRIKRAPRWMRTLGLEWFYRLLQEPRRVARIWRAVVVFPWLVVTQR